MKKLLVASANRKKLKELQVLLEALHLELVCLSDLSSYEEVSENGKTFEENAEIKALGYAQQTGLLTLAEDSGFCVESLAGAPGILSARFSGPAKDDGENNRKVLRLMKGIPDEKRMAYFKSVVSIAEPGRVLETVAGEVRGYVSQEVRGRNGFGYDPIFYYPSFDKTFGEVSSEMKHQVSHRAKALRKAMTFLKQYSQE